MAKAARTNKLFTQPHHGTRITHNENTNVRPPGMGNQPDDGNLAGPNVMPNGREVKPPC